jgi:hypothetical protein
MILLEDNRNRKVCFIPVGRMKSFVLDTSMIEQQLACLIRSDNYIAAPSEIILNGESSKKGYREEI